jgi:hypothetical protein
MRKPIPGYENQYEMDETGIIYSLPREIRSGRGLGYRKTEAKVLKTFKNTTGVECVQLFKDNKRKVFVIKSLKNQLFA